MIELVRFDTQFLNKSYIWLNDEELLELINAKRISFDDQIKWFNSLDERVDYHIWGLKYNNEPIGAAGLKRINYDTMSAEYFGYIGEKKYWSRGLGKYIINAVLEKAKELSLIHIYLTVKKNNIRAIRLYEKQGFNILSEKLDHIDMIMDLYNVSARISVGKSENYEKK